MKRILLFGLFGLIFSTLAVAQVGEIQGRILDQNGESIFAASVVVELNSVQVEGTSTDFDGRFSMKPLNPGTYVLKASYLGKNVSVSDISVRANQTTFLDDIIVNTASTLETVEIVYEAPPIDQGKPESGTDIGRKEIEKMPRNNLTGIISNAAGTYQADDNSTAINIGGSRSNANKIMIDGVDLSGVFDLPVEAIDQVQVVTGGIEAKQGDLTGGIISISTRGPSKNFRGSAEIITSQYLDNFGYNQGRLTLLGPLYTKNKGKQNEKAILGFLLTGEALLRKDNDPPAFDLPYVKADKLEEITKTPLIRAETGTNYNKASEFLTEEDLEYSPIKRNNSSQQYSGFMKIDFKPTRAINVTLGANGRFSKRNAYIGSYSLMNSQNNPTVTSADARAYVKFTQRFLGLLDKEKQEANRGKLTLSSFYYTLQADFQKNYYSELDASHMDRLFDYGYVGKFETSREPVYQIATDSITGNTMNVLVGYQDVGVKYTAGDKNPEFAKYTDIFFENTEATTLNQVTAQGGLLNGDFSNSNQVIAYSLYYNNGMPYTRFRKDEDDQFGFRIDASMDLKRSVGDKSLKHNIEFGIEYQQNVNRFFSISPIGIWRTMRQSMNFHIADLDLENPYYLVNGERVYYTDYTGEAYTFDTITYDRRVDIESQRYFDYSVRKKLGLETNGRDFVDIDGLEPSFFSLDMFSPDELLNGGNPLVRNYGYDYYGNKIGSVSFNDFFTQRNGNGEEGPENFFTRNMDAYRPIYNGFYIQDKFNIGKVIFRVGVRTDIFDANQKVLRDEYSLYGLVSAGDEATANLLQDAGQERPENIQDEYAVYVDNLDNPSQVIGYRDENTWFDANGVALRDPTVISRNGIVPPFLIDPNSNIKDAETFDPDNSFTDYQPQINPMPRIAFSFPITETAMFTAFYDLLTQRPTNGVVANPYHYYYLEQLATDQILPNPNLKPEKTISYQLGFQQALNDYSALKISAFYKEIRDLIQVRQISFAYPRDYRTYGNIDFGTVKGLTVAYDMIRSVNNFRMSASYTLQFADGTGSSATSQANLINAGQPNLRTILPLSYDARNTLTLDIDYRFGNGESYSGPKVGGKDIFQNAGMNLSARARSGTPYSRQLAATPTAQFGVASRPVLLGTPNGSRLPWNYKLDLRVDKDFPISKHQSLNVFLLVQNLLDTRNILGLYRFTGSATDDGFLQAPTTQEVLAGQVNQQSFIDLYSARVNNPDNFTLPRRIQLGAKFKF